MLGVFSWKPSSGAHSFSLLIFPVRLHHQEWWRLQFITGHSMAEMRFELRSSVCLKCLLSPPVSQPHRGCTWIFRCCSWWKPQFPQHWHYMIRYKHRLKLEYLVILSCNLSTQLLEEGTDKSANFSSFHCLIFSTSVFHISTCEFFLLSPHKKSPAF